MLYYALSERPVNGFTRCSNVYYALQSARVHLQRPSISDAWPVRRQTYKVGQIKQRRLTSLLVTIECVHKIQLFLAHKNCIIKQQLVRCRFYVNESITRQRASGRHVCHAHLMHTDAKKSLQIIFPYNVCNNNDFVIQNSEACIQCIRYSDPRHNANHVSNNDQ